MSAPRTPTIDDTIELLLRGAAALLGCNSASLVLVNESAGTVWVRVGALRAGNPLLTRVEALLGGPTRGIQVPFERARHSLIHASWQRRELLETSAVEEVVGTAFPASIAAALSKLIGPRRFLCVPTMSATRIFGVLLFERPDPSPYGAAQRELLLRYASRIANLLENDLLVRQADGDVAEPIRENLLRLVSEDLAPALLVDRAGSVLATNSAAAWLFHASAEDLRGRPLASLFVDAEAVARVVDGGHLFDAGETVAEPIELRLGAGRRLPVELTPLLMMDDSGKSVGMVVQLRPVGREREGRGDSRDAVLRRERLATLGELAAQLAHEVRNPLVAVGAALEGLALDYAHDARLAGELELLNREIVRVDLILRDYLTMAGRHRITPERLDLGALVEESARIGRAHRTAAGRELRVTCPASLFVRADRDGLRQVLLNLWINAMEASPEGSVVECDVHEDAASVAIVVADRGTGLPDGDPFAPFFTTKPHGTGLGLTVCRRIVEAHGGTLALAPRGGGGTVAVMTLPHRGGARGGSHV